MRIILFGTPAFAIPIADALRSLGEVVAVVTQPDRPKGRKQILTPPALKAWAQKHGIPVLQPEKLDADFLKTAQNASPDVGVIASYGNIIPKSVLDIFPRGIVNVHPSLLPRHRGASPVQATILSGDSIAGITLMLTDEEMDHGPIIAQEHLPIWPHESAHELQERLSHHAAELLANVLPEWVAGKRKAEPQDHAAATYTKMFNREDGKIDWTQPAGAIERQIRALNPWPGTFTTLPDGTRLKVLYIGVLAGETADPGTVRKGETGEPEVRAEDAWIRLIRVQPEGKTEMDGRAFLNGHQQLPGAILA